MAKKLILKDAEFADNVIDLADEMVEIARDANNNGTPPADVEDKVIESVAAFLDSALPFDVIIPGIAGEILEAKDGEVIEDGLEKLVAALKQLFKVDEEKKAARKAKRDRKKAKRKARKANK